MSRQPFFEYHANKALVNINFSNGKNKNIVNNPGCAFELVIILLPDFVLDF